MHAEGLSCVYTTMMEHCGEVRCGDLYKDSLGICNAWAIETSWGSVQRLGFVRLLSSLLLITFSASW
jgi:hypothetical protein